MAKNEVERKRPATPPVADNQAAEQQPESLDKVRDILFGGQMRAVETRLRGLEERIREEHDALRADLVRQITELDASTRREMQAIDERLATERTKRTESIKVLTAEIKETIRALEKRHMKLEEATGAADAALRDQLLLQARATSADQAKLVDRLSGLFADLSTRIAGNPTGKNGPRG
jgi:hypothetical protein